MLEVGWCIGTDAQIHVSEGQVLMLIQEQLTSLDAAVAGVFLPV